MKNFTKAFGMAILAIAFILVSGCKNNTSNAQKTITGVSNSLQQDIENMAEDALEPKVAVDGNTITYGDHS